MPCGSRNRSPGLSEANEPPPETVITLYSLSCESFLTRILPGGTFSPEHAEVRKAVAANAMTCMVRATC